MNYHTVKKRISNREENRYMYAKNRKASNDIQYTATIEYVASQVIIVVKLAPEHPVFLLVATALLHHPSSWYKLVLCVGGYLRAAVRSVDLLLVLLQDALAVELLRGGGKTLSLVSNYSYTLKDDVMTYVLRRPLLISQHNTLDHLKAGKSALLPRALQLLQHRIVDLLVVNQLFEMIALDALLSGELLERRLSGNNDSDRLLAVLGSVDTDVLHNGRAAVHRLQLLERDVLARERLDEVLLAVNDADVPVGVEFANVACLEPAVLSEGLGGFLGHVQVSAHHTAAADPNLTLWGFVGGVVSCVCEVDELHFNRGGHLAERAIGPSERVHKRTHGAGFGETVTGNHGRDGEGDEALGFLCDRATAVHADAESTTSGFLDLIENDCVEQAGAGKARVKQEALGRVGAPEHLALDGAAGFHLGNDALLNCFPDLGHADHDGGLQFADVTGAVAHRGVGERADGAVAHGSSPVQNGVFEHELEDVRCGEVCDEDVARTQVLADNSVDTGNFVC